MTTDNNSTEEKAAIGDLPYDQDVIMSILEEWSVPWPRDVAMDIGDWLAGRDSTRDAGVRADERTRIATELDAAIAVGRPIRWTREFLSANRESGIARERTEEKPAADLREQRMGAVLAVLDQIPGRPCWMNVKYAVAIVEALFADDDSAPLPVGAVLDPVEPGTEEGAK